MARSVAASEDDLMPARDEEHKRGPRKPPFKFLVPLIYAPILPLIRIGLRKQPVLRDRVFIVTLAAALLHGGYLVDLTSMMQRASDTVLNILSNDNEWFGG